MRQDRTQRFRTAGKVVQRQAFFDFTLSDEDRSAIAELDTGHMEIIDHYNWKTAAFLNTVKGRE